MAPPKSRFNIEKISGNLEEFTDGAITYMYLENFVTYDKCEFYPGPFMNMIMGPNGTGKSSVVAAMALGFGWHPNVLGRSKDASEFIKYGKETSVIEMALKCEGNLDFADAGGGRQVEFREDGIIIIRRELKRLLNASGSGYRHSSEWFINGKTTTAKVIALIMKQLNVQIDNLCQFLPQDKVSEFAKLSPSEILLETERAAAPPIIAEQHQQLISLRSEQKNLQANNEEIGKRLNSLIKQNENMEGIIQRIQQREQHLKMIKLMEKKRPWLEYNRARERWIEFKEKRDLARIELKEAEKNSNPLKEIVKEAKEKLKTAERQRISSTREAESAKTKIKKLIEEKIAEKREKIEGLKNEVINVRSSKAKRENAIIELSRVVKTIEEELRNAPGDIDEDPMRLELQEIKKSVIDLENELEETIEKAKRIGFEGEKLNKEVEGFHGEIRRQEDVKVQKLTSIQRTNEDVARAYEWLEKNRNSFKSKVFGPICIEINVKDGRFSRLVESLVSVQNLISFVFTNYEDHEYFQRKMEDEFRWKVNSIIVEECSNLEGGRYYLSNSDSAELKKLGFLGTVLDLIDGPEEVLVALCEINKIHLMPIGLENVDHSKVELTSWISTYATSEGTFAIRKSKYSNEVAVSVRGLKNSRFLSQQASQERKQELLSLISERRSSLSVNQEKMKKLLTLQESLKGKLSNAKEEYNRIRQVRAEILGEQEEWKRKRLQFELKSGNLQKLIADSKLKDQQEREAERDGKEKLKVLFREYERMTFDCTRLVEEYQQFILEMSIDNLSISMLESNVLRREDELKEFESSNESLRKILAETEGKLLEAKNMAKEYLERASKNAGDLDEETKEAFAELPETLEGLDKQLALERARVEVSDNSTLGQTAIKEYEQRKSQINQLEENFDKNQEKLKNLCNQMTLIHSAWFPEIEQMISLVNERFCSFFSQMNCAGEIRLAPKGTDYSEWSLEILVRFRDNETLQVLSAQRQSGGEKSVSTILFLLSLQELARSPFRVVDEINQGMDANNERRVHSLIVETATRKAKSQ